MANKKKTVDEIDEVTWRDSPLHILPQVPPIKTNKVCRKKSEVMARFHRLKRYSNNKNEFEITVIVYELMSIVNGDSWLYSKEDMLKIMSAFGMNLDHTIESVDADRNIVDSIQF